VVVWWTAVVIKKYFILHYFVLSSLYIGGAKAYPGKIIPKLHEHIDQGTLTLFSQNYSKAKGIPNNYFHSKTSG